jgi:chaperonin GroEL
MSNSRIVFSSESRGELLKGLALAADTITCTLGPGGKTVLIAREDGQGAPLVTKDGVTVARAIKLRNSLQRQGAELVKEASNKTNEVAGDGTTTAALLTLALSQAAVKLLDNGSQAREVLEGYDLAHAEVKKHLADMVKPADTIEDLEKVALVSSNGDVSLSKLIAESVFRVGADGLVQLEETKSVSNSVDYVDGVLFDRGYVSPYFVNNSERMISHHEDAFVFVSDKKLSSWAEIVPVIEVAALKKKSLLVIADEFDDEVLQGLVVNTVKGKKPFCAVVAPGQGKLRAELLKDIESLTGCVIFGTNKSLSAFKETDFGTAKSFTVDVRKTVIVSTGDTAKTRLVDRLAELSTRADDPEVEAREVADLRVRIARLSGGVAILRVGGSTEIEMIEKKHRAEDALCSTRAAFKSGVLPGGGEALRRASCNTEQLNNSNASIVFAYNVFLTACKVPLRKIAMNCEVAPDVVENDIARMIASKGEENGEVYGYNARTGLIEDLWAAKIYDPSLVTFNSLENAVSVARVFASLGACIVEDTE